MYERILVPVEHSPYDEVILTHIRKLARTVDQKKRFAIHTDVTRVMKNIDQPFDMFKVILRAIVLSNQNIMLASVPTASPIFIGPAQAKREVRLA